MTAQVKPTKKVILPVTGMTCASCAATIEKALSHTPGRCVSGVTARRSLVNKQRTAITFFAAP